MKKILAILALAISAFSSAVMFESEPNDTQASADAFFRSGTAPFADHAIASLSLNDKDWFAVTLYAGETFTAITTPLDDALNNTPDTLMALRDSSGTLIEFNDDAAGFGSAIRNNITTTGTYYVQIAGFGAGSTLSGNSTEVGNYYLTISAVPTVVPEPATLSVLGLGLAAVARRRNRK